MIHLLILPTGFTENGLKYVIKLLEIKFVILN